MKIAVCFSGQVRTAIHAEPNLKRFFGELLPDIDFFIHTWDINQYKQYGSLKGDGKIPPWRQFGDMRVKPRSQVSQTELKYYRDSYNPKSMEIEPYDHYLLKYTPEQRRRDPVLHYTWKKSLYLCLDYSFKNNIRYDAVIKLRPDMIFPPKRTLSREIDNFLNDPDAFYCDNGTETTTDDLFWLSSMKTMLALSNFGDPELHLDNNLLFSEFILGLGIKLRPMVMFGYAPLRVEALSYNVLTQFGDIFYTDHLWYSADPPQKWIEHE